MAIDLAKSGKLCPKGVGNGTYVCIYVCMSIYLGFLIQIYELCVLCVYSLSIRTPLVSVSIPMEDLDSNDLGNGYNKIDSLNALACRFYISRKSGSGEGEWFTCRLICT